MHGAAECEHPPICIARRSVHDISSAAEHLSGSNAGIKFLSDLRADVLTASTAANRDSNTPHLRALSEALK